MFGVARGLRELACASLLARVCLRELACASLPARVCLRELACASLLERIHNRPRESVDSRGMLACARLARVSLREACANACLREACASLLARGLREACAKCNF